MKLCRSVRIIAHEFQLLDVVQNVARQYLRVEYKVKELMYIPVGTLHTTDEAANAGEVHYRRSIILGCDIVTVSKVVLHPLIMNSNSQVKDEDRKDQVIHEIGHLIAIIGNGDVGHGPNWSAPTIDLGGTAEILHRLKLGPTGGE